MVNKVLNTKITEAQLQLLNKINKAIVSVYSKEDLVKTILKDVKGIFTFYDTGLVILNKEGNMGIDWVAVNPELDPSDANFEINNNNLVSASFKNLMLDTCLREVEKAGHPIIYTVNAAFIKKYPEHKDNFKIIKKHGVKQFFFTYLKCRGKLLGTFNINATENNFFKKEDAPFFQAIADYVAIAVSNILDKEEILEREKEKAILLSLSKAAAAMRDKNELWQFMIDSVQPLIGFKISVSTIYSDDFTKYKYYQYSSIVLNVVEENLKLGFSNWLPFKNTSDEWVFEQGDVSSLNMDEKTKVAKGNPEAITILKSMGIDYNVYIKLKANGKVFGVQHFHFTDRHTIDEKKIELAKAVTQLIASALANILANEEILHREKEKDVLLNISQKLSNAKKMDEILHIILKEVQPVFNFYDTGILLIDKATKSYYDVSVIHPHIDNSEVNSYLNEKKYYKDNFLPLKNSVPQWLMKKYAEEKYFLFDYETDFSSFSDVILLQDLHNNGYKEACCCLLTQQGETIGLLFLNYKEKGKIPIQKISLFLSLAERIGSAIANILANEEIATLNKQLLAQNEYLIEQVEQEYNFDEMIGQNEAFKSACKSIGLVSQTDSTVLILGETGTGKELVARAIHNHSPRKSKPLVKLNCAALPANLIESELFGHERGAFTGAIERRIGKFELANGSTIFLDEIGEMPMELQAKLLRALQEKEIERLGSNKTISVDVRIIAATNRDLPKEVKEGKFRQDLYYRLYIFPLTLPPLRERKEDIPLLAAHFIQKYAKKTGKKIQGLSNKALQEMMAYNFPGNIRELEHIIERCVILSQSRLIETLNLPSASKSNVINSPADFVIKSWDDNEREYILEVLKFTNGNVTGKGGAADLLKLKPTTLQSKMLKLGIKRKHYAVAEIIEK